MQTDEEVGKVAQAVPIIIYILFNKVVIYSANWSKQTIHLPVNPIGVTIMNTQGIFVRP